jgi:hypothetical protein
LTVKWEIEKLTDQDGRIEFVSTGMNARQSEKHGRNFGMHIKNWRRT